MSTEQSGAGTADPNFADATPHAASLIQSLRDIGYSCETAVADIIDNSITAGAKTVEILSDASGDDLALAVLDDGTGMTRTELIEAMRPGSRNPLSDRAANDLGRFGLGLKSASFSQCKRLTVVTRKDGQTLGATWDLDFVATTNRWEIRLHEDIEGIPWADNGFAHSPDCRSKRTGTLRSAAGIARFPLFELRSFRRLSIATATFI